MSSFLMLRLCLLQGDPIMTGFDGNTFEFQGEVLALNFLLPQLSLLRDAMLAAGQKERGPPPCWLTVTTDRPALARRLAASTT